jgi:hypothetical protein
MLFVYSDHKCRLDLRGEVPAKSITSRRHPGVETAFLFFNERGAKCSLKRLLKR